MKRIWQASAVVLFVLINWMLWSLGSVPQRMILIGACCLLAGMSMVDPKDLLALLGKVLLGVAVLCIALGLTLQYAVPYVIHRTATEVQRVQVDTAERVKETLTPSWFERLTSR